MNSATHPVLLAIASLLLSRRWKWRSKTAYGSATLWTRELGGVNDMIQVGVCIISSCNASLTARLSQGRASTAVSFPFWLVGSARLRSWSRRADMCPPRNGLGSRDRIPGSLEVGPSRWYLPILGVECSQPWRQWLTRVLKKICSVGGVNSARGRCISVEQCQSYFQSRNTQGQARNDLDQILNCLCHFIGNWWLLKIE